MLGNPDDFSESSWGQAENTDVLIRIYETCVLSANHLGHIFPPDIMSLVDCPSD